MLPSCDENTVFYCVSRLIRNLTERPAAKNFAASRMLCAIRCGILIRSWGFMWTQVAASREVLPGSLNLLNFTTAALLNACLAWPFALRPCSANLGRSFAIRALFRGFVLPSNNVA